jgi:negative regulator of sigma E activity
MEPLGPQDPLGKLLGKARQADPRPNFTQNVLRAVRQLPQQESGWERFRESLSRWLTPGPALAGACAVLLAAFVGVWSLKTPPQDGGHNSGNLAVTRTENASDAATAEPDVVTELAQMDQFSQLLAQQDTKSLSDNDVAALLY